MTVTQVVRSPNAFGTVNGAQSWDGSAWRAANNADVGRLSDGNLLIPALRLPASPSTYGYAYLTYAAYTIASGVAIDELRTYNLSTLINGVEYHQVNVPWKAEVATIATSEVRAIMRAYDGASSEVVNTINTHPRTGSNDLRTLVNDMQLLIEVGDAVHAVPSGYGATFAETLIYFKTYTRPTLTVTAPSPISGATVSTAKPTITWTWVGDLAQYGYRVKVFQSGTANANQYGHGSFNPLTSTPVYDSGDVTSASTSHKVATNLSNSTTYRAYVYAWQRMPNSGFLQTTLIDTTFATLGSTQYSQFTTSFTAPPAPTAGTVTPVSGATVTTDIPSLGVTLAAHSVTGIKVKAEWLLATDSGFSANLRTITEPDSDFRTSGATTETITAGANELFQGTWYIKARAIDENGMAGSYTSSQSFTVSHAPSPINLTPTGQASRSGNTVTLGWYFSDPSPTDFQTAYQVVIERDSDGAVVVDSTKVTSTNQDYTYTLSAPYTDIMLRWKVKVWDSDDVASAYTAYQQFFARSGPTVAITFPSGSITSPTPTITWNVTVNGGRFQSQYLVTITESGNTVYSSGWTASSVGAHMVTDPGALVYGHTYTITVTVQDNTGIQGSGTFTGAASWTPPNTPTVTVDASLFDTAGYINVTWPENRDTAFVNYKVYRRSPGDTVWTLLGTTTDLDNPYAFHDYTAPNAPLEYAVTQTATVLGVQIESVPSAVSVSPAGSHYWVICTSNTALSTRLYFVKDDAFSDEWEQETIQLIGRGRRVERGTHYGRTGTLSSQLRDQTGLTARQQRLNLEAMKSGTTEVYLRTPFGDMWRVVLGDLQFSRVAGVGTNEFMDFTVDYQEVA